MSTTEFARILRKHKVKPSAVATSLGLNKATISRWQRVPPERVLEVEKATGISRHELRPDLSSIFVSSESAA